MPNQNEQSIVVTGGSRGIGRAICLAFAGPGKSIFFNYFPEDDAAAETIKLITDKGGKAEGLCVDVVSEQDVSTFFKHIINKTGKIDVLVNNAGITKDTLIVRMKEKDWDAVMDINLKGAFICMKAAAKAMMKQRSGRIVNITSISGVSGNPGQSNYAASKAGLIGLTKTAAKELAPRGITVNAVAPGFIETDMTSALAENVKETIIKQIPLGRSGKPEDVAGVVSFLASKNGAYVTGQVIHVSGGMYI